MHYLKLLFLICPAYGAINQAYRELRGEFNPPQHFPTLSPEWERQQFTEVAVVGENLGPVENIGLSAARDVSALTNGFLLETYAERSHLEFWARSDNDRYLQMNFHGGSEVAFNPLTTSPRENGLDIVRINWTRLDHPYTLQDFREMISSADVPRRVYAPLTNNCQDFAFEMYNRTMGIQHVPRGQNPIANVVGSAFAREVRAVQNGDPAAMARAMLPIVRVTAGPTNPLFLLTLLFE